MVPRKRNQPQLTREQIVSATMKLIDEHGLEGHSMRQLGAELGVDPSTVYYYIPSKNDLYNLIVDEIMSGIDLSADDPSTPVEDRLVAAAHEYLRALLVHPRAMPLAATRSLRTPQQIAGVESLVGMFFDAGFTPTETLAAIDVFGMQVLGMANAYAAHLTHSEYHQQDESLGELPPDRFPNVMRLLTEGGYAGFAVEFERGVRALVRGLLDLHAANALITPDDPLVTYAESGLATPEGADLPC
jgi:AcrR family transcriptional regulator